MNLPRNRVAVTGLGALTPLGENLAATWENIIIGRPGVSLIENIDTTPLSVKIAGEIKNFKLSEDLLDYKEAPRFDKFIHYALHSAKEAIHSSGLLEAGYNAERMGCIMGIGMGGFPFIEATDKLFLEKGARRVSPFFIPAVIPNMAPGMISMKFGLKGPNYSLASACASSAHAVGLAATEIMLGKQDAVVTGGAESVICYLPLSGFAIMKALSRNNENPAEASRPFDLNRDGFVMGEGAGLLVLENLEKAKARGATIYAEIVGDGASSDAHHITEPHPEGEGAKRCMQLALENAGIKPEDIGYINAHGTATPKGDIGETNAIKKVFGEHAYKLLVSSTKSMTGHLLGAAGGVESIMCVMALHTGTIPPTINLTTPDPQCDLNYVPNKAVRTQVEYAMNNSFGFGGTNSTLVFKRYH